MKKKSLLLALLGCLLFSQPMFAQDLSGKVTGDYVPKRKEKYPMINEPVLKGYDIKKDKGGEPVKLYPKLSIMAPIYDDFKEKVKNDMFWYISLARGTTFEPSDLYFSGIFYNTTDKYKLMVLEMPKGIKLSLPGQYKYTTADANRNKSDSYLLSAIGEKGDTQYWFILIEPNKDTFYYPYIDTTITVRNADKAEITFYMFNDVTDIAQKWNKELVSNLADSKSFDTNTKAKEVLRFNSELATSLLKDGLLEKADNKMTKVFDKFNNMNIDKEGYRIEPSMVYEGLFSEWKKTEEPKKDVDKAANQPVVKDESVDNHIWYYIVGGVVVAVLATGVILIMKKKSR